jgi:Rod binding domain-containing protein
VRAQSPETTSFAPRNIGRLRIDAKRRHVARSRAFVLDESRRREAPASAAEALPSGALNTQVTSQWRCVMKRSISSLIAAAALGLATVSYAQTSPGPQPSDQAAPAQQQPMTPAQHQQPMPPGSEPAAGEPPGGDASAAAAPPASGDAATRLAAVVPSGMSPQEACAEFRSVEECATALHLAQNINIPFKDLKSRLKNGERVSAIIHDAKPQADPKAEISRAQDQARADLSGQPQG